MRAQALAARERLFTAFLDRIASGGQPGTEQVEEVLAALWKALRWELERRGMWHRPPGYLGVYGLASWAEAERAGPPYAPGPGEGMELVAECFRFIFLDRYRYLVRQLEVRGDVEGLVHRNVRNFLHDRQKSHDPVGFRVFTLLRAAARAAVAAGELHVLSGEPGVHGATVLGFAPAGRPTPEAAQALEELTGSWADPLLPDLITARGRHREAVVATLRERLAGLREEGIESFRFGDLVRPLVRGVRARWGAVYEVAQGEIGFESGAGDGEDEGLLHLVRRIGPDTGVEERESFRRLAECIGGAVARHGGSPQARRHLEALWRFLAARAAEPGPAAELPSRRRLAALLGIPRNRMPALYAALGEITTECRRRLAARPPAIPAGEPEERSRVLAGLARALVATRDRHARQAAELRREIDRPPAPGDLFVLPRGADNGVEWALLERDRRDPRSWLAVPADPNPLAGSADVAISRESAAGPLTLRCGFAARLDAGELETRWRTGVLAPEIVERALHLERRADRGELEAPSGADHDPEYRQWLAEVVAPARAAAGGASGERGGRPRGKLLAWPSSSVRERRYRAAALAASLLLAAALGLTAGLMLRPSRPTAPGVVVNPPLVTFHAGDPVRSSSRAVTLTSEDTLLLLLFAVGDPGSTYRLEISRAETGETVWSGAVPATGLGEVSVGVPARLLPAGDYLLRLEPRSQGGAEGVGEWELTMVREAAGAR